MNKEEPVSVPCAVPRGVRCPLTGWDSLCWLLLAHGEGNEGLCSLCDPALVRMPPWKALPGSAQGVCEEGAPEGWAAAP